MSCCCCVLRTLMCIHAAVGLTRLSFCQSIGDHPVLSQGKSTTQALVGSRADNQCVVRVHSQARLLASMLVRRVIAMFCC